MDNNDIQILNSGDNSSNDELLDSVILDENTDMNLNKNTFISRYTKNHIILSIARIVLFGISIGLVQFCLMVNKIGRMTSTFQGLLCGVLIYIMFFLIYYPVNGIIKTVKIFKLNKENQPKYIIINIIFILTYLLDFYGIYFAYLVLFKGV